MLKGPISNDKENINFAPLRPLRRQWQKKIVWIPLNNMEMLYLCLVL